MTMSATLTRAPAVEASFAFLDEVLSGYGPRDFAVRAWNGEVREPEAGQSTRFTLGLKRLLSLPGDERPRSGRLAASAAGTVKID